jgi:hypothetical protein
MKGARARAVERTRHTGKDRERQKERETTK